MALPDRRLESTAAAVTAAFIPFFFAADTPSLTVLFLTGLFILFSLVFLFRYKDMEIVSRDLALLFLGVLYIPFLLGHLALIRLQPAGVEWIFLLLVIVMAGDTAAYYTGSAFGRRRLYPSVSPKKSMEGAVGGLAGSVIGTFVARATFFPGLTALDCILLPLLLGPLGQLGDLFESLLKRSFRVKDSGWIIPGHGGVLDRLDSILFAAPALYYYIAFRFGG